MSIEYSACNLRPKIIYYFLIKKTFTFQLYLGFSDEKKGKVVTTSVKTNEKMCLYP